MLYFVKNLKIFTPEMSCCILIRKHSADWKVFTTFWWLRMLEFKPAVQNLKFLVLYRKNIPPPPPQNPVIWGSVLLGVFLIWSDEAVYKYWSLYLSSSSRASLYAINSNRPVHDRIHVITKNLSEVVGVNYFLPRDYKGISVVHTYASNAVWDTLVCLTHLHGTGRYGVGPEGDLSPSGTVAGDRHLQWH